MPWLSRWSPVNVPDSVFYRRGTLARVVMRWLEATSYVAVNLRRFFNGLALTIFY